ncbi:uncharacterized protein B0T23DRAFT_321570, partial [Neurospora hispaniola]
IISPTEDVTAPTVNVLGIQVLDESDWIDFVAGVVGRGRPRFLQTPPVPPSNESLY